MHIWGSVVGDIVLGLGEIISAILRALFFSPCEGKDQRGNVGLTALSADPHDGWVHTFPRTRTDTISLMLLQANIERWNTLLSPSPRQSRSQGKVFLPSGLI